LIRGQVQDEVDTLIKPFLEDCTTDQRRHAGVGLWATGFTSSGQLGDIRRDSASPRRSLAFQE
jgi:hypothetical protein